MPWLKSLALSTASIALTIAAPLAQDRPDLSVAVNGLPGSFESIEEMGNVLADGSGREGRVSPGDAAALAAAGRAR